MEADNLDWATNDSEITGDDLTEESKVALVYGCINGNNEDTYSR